MIGDLEFGTHSSIPNDQTATSTAHSHPEDVLGDPMMDEAAKRALLASWISDARAVEGFPALRRMDNGAYVSVDDILDAIKALDADTQACSARDKVRRPWRPLARRRLARFPRVYLTRGIGSGIDPFPPGASARMVALGTPW